MKYIDAERLIAEINKRLMAVDLETLRNFGSHRVWAYNDVKDLITSLQQEQPELPPIGYAETYYQRGLHDGIIKGRINILRALEDIEKRKAKPVLVIKEREQLENKEKIMNFFAAVGDCGFSQHDILLLKNICKETECTPPKSQVADASKMEQPEVDLEKDIDAFFDKWDKNSYGCIFDENGAPVTIKTIKGVVKHFLNARKEE